MSDDPHKSKDILVSQETLTDIQQLFRKAYLEGYDLGVKHGYKQGYDVGHTVGQKYGFGLCRDAGRATNPLVTPIEDRVAYLETRLRQLLGEHGQNF